MSLVVIKLNCAPGLFGVTRCAVLHVLVGAIFMRTILLMTGNTAGARLAKLFAFCMTRGAAHILVAVMEGKVSLMVIKTQTVKFHDIGIPPDVLGMAALTLGGTMSTEPAMKSLFFLEISGDLFVAIQTEGALVFLAQ